MPQVPPTFLVETIRDRNINPQDLEEVEVEGIFFEKFTLEALDIPGLLFQTGYLTIQRVEYQRSLTNYFLGYPNREVYRAFTHNLLEAFTYKTDSIVSGALSKMRRGLRQGNVKVFIHQLEILLADISYHLHPKNPSEEATFRMWEGYFQTIIYLITSFIGLYVECEITKHKGRLDLTVETDDFLYLMEFKLDQPAENAIQQIKNRDYLKSYINSPKTIHLVGIGFSQSERNIATWESEIWER